MYKSFQFLGSRGWKIIDTDFIEEHNSCYSLWVSVIKIYERRNLNVAKNLVLAIMHYHYHNQQDSPLQNICNTVFSIPGVEPYREDIEKYLMLV